MPVPQCGKGGADVRMPSEGREGCEGRRRSGVSRKRCMFYGGLQGRMQSAAAGKCKGRKHMYLCTPAALSLGGVYVNLGRVCKP